jgi:small subunit ribosomal protein S2
LHSRDWSESGGAEAVRLRQVPGVGKMENFLIKQETYLEAGIHIGTKLKVNDMNQFIYRMRNDGLYVLDLRKIDERIRLACKMLSQYAPEEVMVVASRTYSGNAAAVFSKLTGIKVFEGRFIPGILTNVFRSDFIEPKLLIVCDPKGERQAVIEAGKMGIPTIGLCDTDNITSFIDWVVPCNNKGRRSLALIFYLFSREYLMGKNKIASYDEFTTPLSAFEAERGEEVQAAAVAAPAAAQDESVAAAAEAQSEPKEEAPAEAPAKPAEQEPAPAEHEKKEHAKEGAPEAHKKKAAEHKKD